MYPTINIPLFASLDLFYFSTVLNYFCSLTFFLFFYFNLYIYPPDSQESDGGAIHRVGNYPDLLPEMPRYCCPLVI